MYKDRWIYAHSFVLLKLVYIEASPKVLLPHHYEVYLITLTIGWS